MNRNKAINEVESKLSSKGYVHPDVHHRPNSDAYTTINIKDKNAVYQRSSKPNIPYASFNHKKMSDNLTEVQKTDICPMCDTKALYKCDCYEFHDMMCKNNHVWWVNTNGQVINGDPHFD